MQKNSTHVSSAHRRGSNGEGSGRASAAALAPAITMAVTLATLLLASPVARAQSSTDSVGVTSFGMVLWDQCGWEGVRACTSNDKITGAVHASELSGSFFSTGAGCDKTLSPKSSGICADTGSRANSALASLFVPSWLASQESDQYSRISADLPMNLVPIMGTHNSYSNSIDGSGNVLSTDQGWTITDQLDLGARMLRLDPVANPTGTSVMVCHSTDLTGTLSSFEQLLLTGLTGISGYDAAHICTANMSVPLDPKFNGLWSYQRPFYLVVEEIQHWLQQHPGEVVLIAVNNFLSSSQLGHIPVADLELVFQHALGSMMLQRGDYQTLIPNGAAWPTVRQVRSLGKQAVVMFSSDVGSDGDTVVWKQKGVVACCNYNSTADPYFYSGGDYDGNAVGVMRDYANGGSREDIGEDRSLSNALPDQNTLETGQMNWITTALSTAIGYNSISFDFFYSLNSAPNSYYPFLGNIDYTTGGSVLDTGLDDRPKWTVWSWPHDTTLSAQPAALVHSTSLSLADTGINLVLSGYPQTSWWMTYRWQQMSASTQLPFACGRPVPGGAFPDTNDAWAYVWGITQGTGEWSQGETQCQKEFGAASHFWRPMSGTEDAELISVMSGGNINQVWLNHFSGQTAALPKQINLSHTLGNSQPATDTASVIVSSGFGGALTYSFSTNSSFSDFINVSQTITGSNIYHISVNDQALKNAPSGQYRGVLTFTEQHPDGTTATTSLVSINLTLSNFSFSASPGTVGFSSGLTQTVSITAPSSPVAFTYDQTQTLSWLTVSFNKMSTPATITVTLDPKAAPSFNIFNLAVTPSDSHYTPVVIPVIVSTVKVTVGTNPPNIPFKIDGADAQAGTVVWVTSSSHQLTTQDYGPPSQPGTQYDFQGWAETIPVGNLIIKPTVLSQTLNISDPAQNSSYIAQFGTYYALVITQSLNGTVSASPQPASNGFYLAGTKVTVSATPNTGYVLKQIIGDVSSQQSPVSLTMNASKSISVSFVRQQFLTTFNTSPAGLSISVDGQTYSTPASFPWTSTESHTVSGVTQNGTQTGTRFAFVNWADNQSSSPRTFTNTSSAASYTLNYGVQYLVSVQITPSLSGAVTGDGWYNANTNAELRATPAAGFNFSSFTGQGVPNSNPSDFTVTAPVQVTATFQAPLRPVLYASSNQRVDLGGGMIQLPIVMNDLATAGPAGDVIITSVTAGNVPTGAGTPTIVNFPQNGISVGTIFPGKNSQTVLTVNWPVSATRATFTVSYKTADGRYQNSNAITLFR